MTNFFVVGILRKKTSLCAIFCRKTTSHAKSTFLITFATGNGHTRCSDWIKSSSQNVVHR